MTDSDVLRIGTRGSPLALAQTNQVAALLQEANTNLKERGKLEIVVIKTTGDRVQNVLLAQLGGKGLFTKELDEAMLEERIDIAIHSMKDVPAEQPEGLCIAAIPEREDARDAFVSRDFDSFDTLPFGARLGTAGRHDSGPVPLQHGRSAAQIRQAPEALLKLCVSAQESNPAAPARARRRPSRSIR